MCHRAKMGGKNSTDARPRTYSNAGEGGMVTSNGAGGLGVPGTSGGMNSRGRTRSLGSVTQQSNSHGRPLSIPSTNGGPHGSGSPDSDTSTPEEGGPLTRGFIQHSSLPVHLFAFHGKYHG